jgi:hypothetical protein
MDEKRKLEKISRTSVQSREFFLYLPVVSKTNFYYPVAGGEVLVDGDFGLREMFCEILRDDRGLLWADF